MDDFRNGLLFNKAARPGAAAARADHAPAAPAALRSTTKRRGDAAETLHGREGRTIHALPHDLLVDAVRRYRPDLLAAG